MFAVQGTPRVRRTPGLGTTQPERDVPVQDENANRRLDGRHARASAPRAIQEPIGDRAMNLPWLFADAGRGLNLEDGRPVARGDEVLACRVQRQKSHPVGMRRQRCPHEQQVFLFIESDGVLSH